MNEGKYYWIKLKTNFFNRDDIDFLLSQENGCQYVVLYQMLCLNTANTEGRMETQMNEIIIPYDIKKITRDCKYFDYDTVAVALELFKKLGLIYEEGDKILKIADYEKMIGSETKWAEKKREYREKQKLLLEGQPEGQEKDNVREENRDKSIENRDKIIDNKKEIIKEKEPKHKYGQYKNVLLTDKELQSLKSDYDNSDELIDYLDTYIEMKGYKAKSHYLCIKKWVIKAVKENNRGEEDYWNE